MPPKCHYETIVKDADAPCAQGSGSDLCHERMLNFSACATPRPPEASRIKSVGRVAGGLRPLGRHHSCASGAPPSPLTAASN